MRLATAGHEFAAWARCLLLVLALCPLVDCGGSGDDDMDVPARDGGVVSDGGGMADRGEPRDTRDADAGGTRDGRSLEAGVVGQGDAGERDARTADEPISAANPTDAAVASQPTAILVTPQLGTLVRGATQQLSVTAFFPDNTTSDVTRQATFASSTASIVMRGSIAVGSAPGTATITASALGLTATATLEVTTDPLTALTIVALSADCDANHQMSFRATTGGPIVGTRPGMGRDVTTSALWTSSDPNLLLLDSIEGEALCLGAGTVTVSAAVGAVHSETTVEIHGPKVTSYAVRGPGLMRAGAELTFNVQLNYEDGSTAIAEPVPFGMLQLDSSDPSVASVGSGGSIAAHATGSAIITATLNGRPLATTKVTVSAAALQSLTLAPAILNITAPARGQFIATGTFADGSVADVTASVAWSDPSARVLVEAGVVTPNFVGSSSVTATMEGKSAAAQVVVLPGTPASVEVILRDGATLPVRASAGLNVWAHYANGNELGAADAVTWTVSDPNVATVGGTPPRVVAIKPGMTAYTAALGAVRSDPQTVQVSEAKLIGLSWSDSTFDVFIGQTPTFDVIAQFDDGSQHDPWPLPALTSSNPGVASISNSPLSYGQITAIAAGRTTLKADMPGFSATTIVTVMR